MKVRCNQWIICLALTCPEWRVHDEHKRCSVESFCPVVSQNVKCVPVSELKRGKKEFAVTVVKKTGSAA